MLDVVCMGTECEPAIRIAQLCVCVFLSVLFLQSGIDKVRHWKDELGWITDHFSKTAFNAVVPQLLGVITLFELSAGVLTGAGAAMLLATGDKDIALLGVTVSAISLIQLFLGQRIAKDYPGAAVLVPYFIVTIAGLLLLAMN